MIYTVFYPTVARRVNVIDTRLPLPPVDKGDEVVLVLSPLHPGIVIEKIVLDFGGYEPSYLFGDETPFISERRLL